MRSKKDTPAYGQQFAIEQVLFEGKSDFQTISIFQTPTFGRALVLDGIVQTTEADEFIYHEMFAHGPIFSHIQCENLLIIGGGDGGLLREALRHKTIKTVDMVEIDGTVVEACKEFMPRLSNGAFDDPRANLIIQDAFAYLKNSEKHYDIILADTTDPRGPSTVLFSHEFFSLCFNALSDHGIFVNQSGIPFLEGNQQWKVEESLQTLFPRVELYQTTVPTYAGGPMVFAMARKGDSVDDLQTLTHRYEASQISTMCYNPELHKASFVLPNYMKDKLWMTIRQ